MLEKTGVDISFSYYNTISIYIETFPSKFFTFIELYFTTVTENCNLRLDEV